MQTGFPAMIWAYILIFMVFYFLLIRPQMRERRKHEEMVRNIKKNDEIVTSGGLHGTVVNVKERTIILRIDDNTKVELEKSAISYVKKKKAENG